MNLARSIYQLTNTFPRYDAIINQMQRAAISIPSNIAEGSSRISTTEFARYLEISVGLETQIELSYMLKYINDNDYDSIIKNINSIERRLSSFIKKLRTQ